MDTSMLLFNS